MTKYLRLIDPSKAECGRSHWVRLGNGRFAVSFRSMFGEWGPLMPDNAVIEADSSNQPIIHEIPDAATPQPIETAPRDGTPILVWRPEWVGWQAAWWVDGWWERTCVDYGFRMPPTHWLPMPPLPKPEPEPQAKPIGDVITIEGKQYRVVPVEGGEND